MSILVFVFLLAVLLLYISTNARMGAVEQKNRMLAQENNTLRTALVGTPKQTETTKRSGYGCTWILLVLFGFALLFSTLIQPLAQ